MIEWLHDRLFVWWVLFGMKILGFRYVLPYVPNKHADEIAAITFSSREDYINKICQAVDGEWPEWNRSDKEVEECC